MIENAYFCSTSDENLQLETLPQSRNYNKFQIFTLTITCVYRQKTSRIIVPKTSIQLYLYHDNGIGPTRPYIYQVNRQSGSLYQNYISCEYYYNLQQQVTFYGTHPDILLHIRWMVCVIVYSITPTIAPRLTSGIPQTKP